MQKTSSMPRITPYRVIKCESNRFILDGADGQIACAARKKIKRRAGDSAIENSAFIVPGDLVLTESDGGESAIARVLPRKNELIRPLVANIDQIIAVAALVPKPDYFLLDKLIINANRQGIAVVLCLNKSDLSEALYAELCAQYQNAVDRIIVTSAAENEIAPLRAVLDGKLSCFAGQSAVGKSSLVNALFGRGVQKTDSVSEKVGRGKNTTTRAEILKLSENTYMIDTPGFSMLDIHGIDAGEFDLYYPEYVERSGACKYHRCTHTVEPGCGVRDAVEAGALNKPRYERYCAMKKELTDKKQKQF